MKVECKHEWIMTPWNPTFTDPGKWRLYACLQCGSDFTAKEIEEGHQRDVLDQGLRFTMRLEESKRAYIPLREDWEREIQAQPYREDQACQDFSCGAAPLGCSDKRHCPGPPPEAL